MVVAFFSEEIYAIVRSGRGSNQTLATGELFYKLYIAISKFR